MTVNVITSTQKCSSAYFSSLRAFYGFNAFTNIMLHNAFFNFRHLISNFSFSFWDYIWIYRNICMNCLLPISFIFKKYKTYTLQRFPKLLHFNYLNGIFARKNNEMYNIFLNRKKCYCYQRFLKKVQQLNVLC